VVSRKKHPRPELVAGAQYDVSGESTSKPTRGIFLEWEMQHCSLHGERLGWRALFQSVKPSGKTGVRFYAPVSSTFVRVTPPN
jgi:hypothetical protein